MARIEPKPAADYPWPLRLFARRQAARYGRVLSPTWLWGRLPRQFAAMLAMLGAFARRRSPLGPELRALVSIRIAQLEGCAFCVDLNAYNLLRAAGSAARASALERWRESDAFDARERVALDLAETMICAGGAVVPAQLEQVGAHLDDDGVVELVAWIAFQSMSAKFNAALGAEDSALCRLPGPAQREAPAH